MTTSLNLLPPGCGNEQIRWAERQLGTRLPPSYSLLVRELGETNNGLLGGFDLLWPRTALSIAGDEEGLMDFLPVAKDEHVYVALDLTDWSVHQIDVQSSRPKAIARDLDSWLVAVAFGLEERELVWHPDLGRVVPRGHLPDTELIVSILGTDMTAQLTEQVINELAASRAATLTGDLQATQADGTDDPGGVRSFRPLRGWSFERIAGLWRPRSPRRVSPCFVLPRPAPNDLPEIRQSRGRVSASSVVVRGQRVFVQFRAYKTLVEQIQT